jgi:predicted Fe-S protein YdhL (DUF1289 family)
MDSRIMAPRQGSILFKDDNLIEIVKWCKMLANHRSHVLDVLPLRLSIQQFTACKANELFAVRSADTEMSQCQML